MWWSSWNGPTNYPSPSSMCANIQHVLSGTVWQAEIQPVSYKNSYMALICKAPGTYPDNFKPAFCDTLMVGDKSSRINACYCIPSTNNRLIPPQYKSPLRAEEKNVELLCKLVSLYTPLGGIVIDPFSRTFTTDIAALKCSRKAIQIYNDKECHT